MKEINHMLNFRWLDGFFDDGKDGDGEEHRMDLQISWSLNKENAEHIMDLRLEDKETNAYFIADLTKNQALTLADYIISTFKNIKKEGGPE